MIPLSIPASAASSPLVTAAAPGVERFVLPYSSIYFLAVAIASSAAVTPLSIPSSADFSALAMASLADFSAAATAAAPGGARTAKTASSETGERTLSIVRIS